MVATRGGPLPGMPRRPSLMRNRYIAYAIPWIDVIPVDVQERGAHLIVAKTPRIPSESVDPTVKNYHWGDLVRAMFEAEAARSDERRVGQEWGSTGRARWWAAHHKKKKTN